MKYCIVEKLFFITISITMTLMWRIYENVFIHSDSNNLFFSDTRPYKCVRYYLPLIDIRAKTHSKILVIFETKLRIRRFLYAFSALLPSPSTPLCPTWFFLLFLLFHCQNCQLRLRVRCLYYTAHLFFVIDLFVLSPSYFRRAPS